MNTSLLEQRAVSTPVVPDWTPDEALLRRFDVPGPRYTAYPTADRFSDAFGPAQYRQVLMWRASAGKGAGTSASEPGGDGSPLSVYMQVPFCESVCYCCACNKVVTRDHGKALPYLDALERELALQVEVLGDALAVAKRQGRLHRNFQGNSTQPDCDLIALGVSACRRVGKVGDLSVVRGIALTPDDLVRRTIIMALMCQGRVDFGAIEEAHGVDFRSPFAQELAQMTGLQAQGLVDIEADGLQLTREGWYFVRAVEMVFDRGLLSHPARAQCSRVL